MIALAAVILKLVRELRRLCGEVGRVADELHDLNHGDQRAVRWTIGKPHLD